MRDKKHIDRLFQEGLKDFEATPSDAVWKNIETELNQDNKKRRILPIWCLYAGVAALLLVFLALGISNTFNNNEGINLHDVVDTETTRSSKIEADSVSRGNTSTAIQTVVANEEVQKETEDVNSEIVKTTSSKKQSQIQLKSNSVKNAVVASSNRPSDAKHFTEKTKTEIVTDSDSEKNTVISSYKAKSNLNTTVTNNGIVETKPEEKVVRDEAIVNNKENGLTIEEALEKANSIIIEKKEMDGRWSIAANAAPVYFNASGEGSAIDPQFNSNSKTGEVNMSYGVTASYAVSKRLRVRSGVNRVNLGYSTNDVVSYQSIGASSVASTLQNVSNPSSSSSQTEQLSLISADNLISKSVSGLLKTSNTINQNLGYIEVPLELQYVLINSKFGVNIIGGFSSLFLNNNEVFSEAQDGDRIFLGEANNINKVSYSANFGLGLNYQVTKKIDLNLEPMLKYQINTFNNTSGDFQPFFVGVYTGLAIKF